MKNGNNRIENERYISLSEAAKIYGCTQKHMNLIARHGKLKAKKIGRNWMTTFQWLEEYTKNINLANGNNGKIIKEKEQTKKAVKLSPFTKKIIVSSLAGIILFVFFVSAYASFKTGALQIPKPIKDFVLKISSNNTQDINKLPSQAITETNRILVASFNLDSVLQNIKYSKIVNFVIDTAETIILGIKAVGIKSDAFFNPIARNVLAFLDKILSDSGNFVINLFRDTAKSICRIPSAINRFFISLSSSTKDVFSRFVSFFSFKSFIPFYYSYGDSDQALVSIRELYQKLRDMRELIEGKAIVINKETQQIIQYITKTTPVQKEVAVIKDQDLLNAQFAIFKDEVLAQIAGDITDFESKIGNQIITQNNYYYSEAAAAAGFNSVNNEVDFNENVDMMKNLSVLDTITAGTFTDGTATLTGGAFSGLTSLTSILGTFSQASISDDLTITNNLDVGGDLTVTGSIIGGAISYNTASISSDFQIGASPGHIFYVDVDTESYEFGGTGTASFVGDLDIEGDVNIGGQFYENQPFTYGGYKVNIISPYETKTNEYKGQLHTHTTGSDGADTPTALETAYEAAGYDFVAITDHDVLTADPIVAGILHLDGVEESTDKGHIVCINPDATTASTSAQAVIDDCTADDAFIFLSHPNRTANPWTTSELERIDGYFGMEVYNNSTVSNSEDKWNDVLTKKVRSYATAGDDCHNVSTGNFNKGWVQVFADSLTEANIVDSLKRGDYYSTTGATLAISVSEKVITATTGASATIDWIINEGVVAQTSSGTSATYTVNGNEVYVIVKITRISDGKEAWSNPIYVHQAGNSKFTEGGLMRGNLDVGGIVSISDDLYVGDDMLFADLSENTIFSSASWDISGNLEFDNLTLTHASISDDLTIGSNITFSDSLASVSGNFLVDGNVGIGITVPGAKLDVVGNTYIHSGNLYTNSILDYTGGGLLLDTGSPGSVALTINNHSTDTITGDLLRVNANSVTKMMVSGIGNVGIGDTAPAYKLSVDGTASISDSFYVMDNLLEVSNASVSFGGTTSTSFAGDLDIEGDVNIGGNDLYVDASTGNVGIGTTVPSAKLNISGGHLTFSGYIAAPGALTASVGAAGTTKYCEVDYPCTYYVAFVNAQGETQGGTESNGITTDDVQINLSNIPIGPTGTTARKIYRSIWGVFYSVTTINDNTTTTYIDDIDGDSIESTDMPIGNTTAGTIYGGATAALKIDESGNIAIGTASPGGTLDRPSFLSLGKTFTENAPSTGNYKLYYGQNSAITIQPSGDSTYGTYYGNNTDITVPSSNTQEIGYIYGNFINTNVKGSGDIGGMEGLVVSTQNDITGTIGHIKGIWAYGTNYGDVSGFFYGLQAGVDSLGGTIAAAIAGRFRIQNSYDSFVGIANPTMTVADAVYANIDNLKSTSGGTQTIGTAYGFHYELANDGTITDSYGLYLGTPSNSGVITNHYGIYLKNQTVSGTTNNYAIYSAGGQNYFAGNVGIGTTSPDYALDVAGQITASSSYINGLFQGKHASISDDLTIGDNITFSDSLASISSTLTLDGIIDSNGTASSTFAGDLDIEGDVNIGGNDLYVDASNGRVGIGTSAPGAPLHIQGTNTSDAPKGAIIMSRYFASAANQRSSAIYDWYNTAVTTEQLVFAVTSTPDVLATGQIKMVINQSNGNVGIGTTNPGGKLSLGSDYANSKLLVFDNGTQYIGLGAQTGEFRFHVNTNTTDFRFYDAPAGNALVTFKGTGNVGIGDTVPAYKLSVDGTASISDSFYVMDNLLEVSNASVSFGGTASSTFAGDLDIEGDVNIGGNDLYVDASTGRVGIGTAAPASYLEINVPTNWYSNDGLKSALIFSYNDTDYGKIFMDQYYNLNILSPYFIRLSPNGGRVGIGPDSTPDFGLELTASVSAYGWFAVTSDEAGDLNGDVFVIDENKNIGIGDTNPAYKLSVDGTASISDSFYVMDNLLEVSNASVSFGGTASSTFAGDLDIEGDVNIGGNDLYVDASTGNVGIGTTEPTAKLHIVGTTGSAAVFQKDSDYATVEFREVGTSGYAAFDLYTNGVQGGTFALSGTTADFLPGAFWLGPRDGNPLYFTTQSTPVVRMAILDGGNVGIGTTAPNYKLSVDGTASVSGDAYFPAVASNATIGTDADGKLIAGTSDIRLKKNIDDIDNALGKLMSLRGVSFNWRTPEEGNTYSVMDGTITHLGFIAQEIASSSVPNLAYTFDDEGQEVFAIREMEITALLVEGVKDIVSSMNIQSEKITSLSAQVEEIRQSLSLNSDGTIDSPGIMEINDGFLTELFDKVKDFGITIENSIVKITQLMVKTLAIEKNSDQTQSSIGEGLIPAENVSAEIRSNQIMANSKIFITFRGDYGSRWWINYQEKGLAIINVADPVAEDIKFDWWIVQTEPVEITSTPIENPVEVPIEEPVASPSETPIETETSVETPIETPLEIPSEIPSTPVESTSTTPLETPSTTPTEPAIEQSTPIIEPVGSL
jgi:hypothetical protein